MTKLKKFHHRVNEHLSFSFTSPESGIKIKKNVFLSRSVALVGLILAITDDGFKVLIEKRSKTMMDSPSKVGLPCGYLDWEETLHSGMMREVYEETSFFMPDYEGSVIYDNDKLPFHIIDDPKSNRQNISLVFISIYDFSKTPHTFPHDVEKFKCKETEWVKWENVDYALAPYNTYDWAFDHDKLIAKGRDLFGK